jgi:hypothetical protein
MSESITVDYKPFQDAIRQLTKETGISMRQVIRWQMGLWVRDIIKKLYADPQAWPPNDGRGLRQKKMGEGAIYGDLLGTMKHRPLFEGMDSRTTEAKWEGGGSSADPRTMNVSKVVDAQALKTKTGAIYLVDKVHYMPHANIRDMERVHQANRRPSDGRVSVAGDANRTVGRWKVKNVYVVPKDMLQQYVKYVQAKVGKAKASWIHPYRYFQTVDRGDLKGLLPWQPPEWLTRHERAMWGDGVAFEQFNASGDKGYVVAGSNIIHGKSPESELQRTVPTRMKDFENGFALKRLQGILKKYQYHGSGT